MISNVWYDNGNRELDSVNGCYYNVTLQPTNYQRSTLDTLFCKRGEKICRKIFGSSGQRFVECLYYATCVIKFV